MNTLKQKFGIALAATTILFTAPACAQKQGIPAPVETVQVAAEAMETGGPALWMVKDADTTIYMFGTVHALPKDVEWYKGTVRDALASSDTIVTEIKMDPSMQAEMQQLVATKGILPQGTTLRGMMTAEDKATYEAALAKLGVPAAAFDQFEPWYAGLTMSMLPLLQQGYSPESGVEKVLLADAAGKPQGALETLGFQIGIFDELPAKSQMEFLIEASDSVDEIKPMLDAMVAEWLEGDADALAELMNEGLEDDVLAEKLLFERNRTWAAWIDERMDAPGTVFIAVGAGHLAGKKSVQDVLNTKGIKTYRIQ
ncbi:MAG: TraB/GumN family protein [Erythrobacter sp.]